MTTKTLDAPSVMAGVGFGLAAFALSSMAQTSAVAATSHAPTAASALQLTPEQAEILSHLSIAYLDDGQGGLAKTIRVTGVNFQVVNGLGATNGLPDNPNADPNFDPGITNGVGNLIVGYNEMGHLPWDDRTGSHNVVVGNRNNYRGYGGLVAAADNEIRGAYTSVLGGKGHTAGGYFC